MLPVVLFLTLLLAMSRCGFGINQARDAANGFFVVWFAEILCPTRCAIRTPSGPKTTQSTHDHIGIQALLMSRHLQIFKRTYTTAIGKGARCHVQTRPITSVEWLAVSGTILHARMLWQRTQRVAE